MTIQNETLPLPDESVPSSGQMSAPDGRDDTTSRTRVQLDTLQHRIGHIRLKARMPGGCIALQLVGPIAAELLTIDEARQLIGALASLIGDLERDARARDWSRRELERITQAVDGSAESYASKL